MINFSNNINIFTRFSDLSTGRMDKLLSNSKEYVHDTVVTVNKVSKKALKKMAIFNNVVIIISKINNNY